MQTKLTLRLDARLIRRAKAYARRAGKSVSAVVADYFALLNQEAEDVATNVPPGVRALRGALRDADGDVADYRRHLVRKYR